MTKPELQRYRINWSAIVKFGDHIKSVCERDGARYLTLAELYGVIGLPEQKAKRIVAELGNIGKQNAIPSAAELRRRFRLTELQSMTLAATGQLARRAREHNQNDKNRISSPQDVDNILRPLMERLNQEQLRVLVLDTRKGTLENFMVYQVTVNNSSIRPAEILRPAVLANVPNIIVAHNHPSGDPQPSPEDTAATRDIRATGKLLDIELLDHIVIGANGRFASMKENGLGFG